MWNPKKSVQLSLICTKIVILMVVACAAALPSLIDRYAEYALVPVETSSLHMFMAILYLCCVPAMAALACLHMLLGNIKNEKVFITRNVKLLRIISWCCFAASLVLTFAVRYYLVFGMMSVAIAFVGLILRVVKNVIEQAVVIKAENDYTI
ncbi:MAG: DUF2975 domain-containing protein [Clostridiales bacterium]|nr:DUF2975 domain-containing protein [Clostridiales bacterium]